MNVTSIPGFTAEASLSKMSEVYQLSTAWLGSAAGQELVPQQFRPFASSGPVNIPPGNVPPPSAHLQRRTLHSHF
jgi:hypothetical protein